MKKLYVTVFLWSIIITSNSQIIGTVDITKIKSDIISIKLNNDYPFYFTYDIGKSIKIDFKTYIIHNKKSFKPKSSPEWVQFFNAYGWEMTDRESSTSSRSSTNMLYNTAVTRTRTNTQRTLTFKKIDKPNQNDINKDKDLKKLKEAKEMLDLGVITDFEYKEKVDQFRNKHLSGNSEDSDSNNIINNENITDEQLQKKLKIDFKDLDSYTKLKQGYKILYKVDKKYYTGNIKFKNSLGEYTIINIEKYNESNDDWELEKIDYSSIPINKIIGYRL